MAVDANRAAVGGSGAGMTVSVNAACYPPDVLYLDRTILSWPAPLPAWTVIGTIIINALPGWEGEINIGGHDQPLFGLLAPASGVQLVNIVELQDGAYSCTLTAV
jgi:hypothetical protein